MRAGGATAMVGVDDAWHFLALFITEENRNLMLISSRACVVPAGPFCSHFPSAGRPSQIRRVSR